jgi:hypothetical protein
VRGEEPALVEALRMRALPEGGLKRCSRCGVSGVAPNAPKPDEAPSGMRGNEDEAMIWELNPRGVGLSVMNDQKST